HPQAIIIATGSEVSVALQAQEQLQAKGVMVRVVSMPCTQRFDAQSQDWRAAVLPADLPKVAVEAGSTLGWHKYVGTEGAVVGFDVYGKAGPDSELFEYYAIDAAQVVAAVENIL